METEQLSNGKEILCALAGPLGSLMLLLFAKRLPRIAICGFLHAVFNMLPVFPMDGGRVLHSAASMTTSEVNANRIETIFAYVVRSAIILGCCYCSFCLHLGPLPIAIGAVLIVKSIKRPCKQELQRVQ